MTPPNISQLPKSLQPSNTIAQQEDKLCPYDEATLRTMCEMGPEIRMTVDLIIKQWKLPYTITSEGKLQDAIKGSELHLKRFVTVDQETLEMKSIVPKIAKCQDEVLIHGETGTGKEIIARAMIGDRQETAGGKFVAVNCAGLPTDLIESELFGHARGSFTGADSTKQGMLKVAENGIIFLDEIGELPLMVQGKLLRAIQELRIRKVGAKEEEDINCKFVFATNRNIQKMVKDGSFRQDLYARISTFELYIKPLQRRECDIIPILQSMPKGKDFLKYCTEQSIRPEKDLDLQHNVRSLHQYVRRFAVLGSVNVLSS